MKVVKKPLEVGDRVVARTGWTNTSGKGTVTELGPDGGMFEYRVELDNADKNWFYNRNELTKLKPKSSDAVDGWTITEDADNKNDCGDNTCHVFNEFGKSHLYVRDVDDDVVRVPVSIVIAALKKANLV